MKDLIYVCSPFRGNENVNVRKARAYCRYIVQIGKIPIAPHLYFPQFLNDHSPTERELGISIGIELLKRCEEVCVFGNIISEGMAQEIEYAKTEGKVVKYLGSECDL